MYIYAPLDRVHRTLHPGFWDWKGGNTCMTKSTSYKSRGLRPISLLRLSLPRFVASSFPGNSPWTWEFHPVNLRL